MRTAVLLVFAMTIFAVAAPVPKAVKKTDTELLEGRWKIVTHDSGNGPKAQAGDDATRYFLVKEGKLFTGTATLKGYADRPFKLVVEQSPKHLDIEHTDGHVLPCIYELDGDTLKWCHAQQGQPRPTEFKGGGGQYSFVYKRVKE